MTIINNELDLDPDHDHVGASVQYKLCQRPGVGAGRELSHLLRDRSGHNPQILSQRFVIG